jgi:hypothetical protein
MSNSEIVLKKTAVELDGFADFTDEVEGEDNTSTGSSAIQGSKIKFLDPDWWLNGVKITHQQFTVVGVANVVNKWGSDNKLLVSRVLEPGEKFPDFDKLNAECPKSEWRMAFGQLVGPWSGQHLLYMIDKLYNPYTWASPTTTVGSAIAVRNLVEQINRVRRFRGEHVYPLVELSHVHFPNAYKSDRERPDLKIIDWVRFGDGGNLVSSSPNTPALTGPTTATPEPKAEPKAEPSGRPPEAQSVEPITLKEELGDELPF